MRLAILSLLALAVLGCQRPGATSPQAATNKAPSPGLTPAAVPTKAAPVVGLNKVPLPEIFGKAKTDVVFVPPPREGGFALSREEQDFLRATNEARRRQDLSALRANPALFELARNHAARMARLQQTEYELEGKSLPQEVEAAFPDQSYAMALGSSASLNCPLILESWLKDPEIKEQILDGEYVEAGIGIARDAGGQFYYVEVLQAAKK